MSFKNRLFVGKITPKMMVEEGWRPMVWVNSELKRIIGWYRYNRASDVFRVKISEPRPSSVSAAFSISGDDDSVEWSDWKTDRESVKKIHPYYLEGE